MLVGMQGYYEDSRDNGLPAGDESLRCLSSKVPRWIGDSHWDDKVSLPHPAPSSPGPLL